MLPIILIILAVVIVVFLIIVAMQPADFRVARSTTIAASPQTVFARVNNLRHWEDWSPWAKLDPEMKQTYEGPEAGVGASYAWAGNKKVGEGRMTITESRPNELVRLKLEFLKPFAAVNTTEFTFTPEGDQTTVDWSLFGKNNFMAKAFCMFKSMDNMVGKDFEKGLRQLKTAVEEGAKK